VTSTRADEEFRAGSVLVRWEGEHLHVDYQWSFAAGMPERYSRRDVLVLGPGQWGRLRYNARRSDWDGGEWSYEKWTFNIGLFPALDARVFVGTEPVKVHSQMALLW
jgi:hypothetical protein